ncbi:MAG: N-acetylmuramic acid 6-phosphate etherase [Elusimicrobiaceae bacterium]|jgi:N-acetylmuramic acid 6-phosphate etherase
MRKQKHDVCDFSALPTEQDNPETGYLDRIPPAQVVQKINAENYNAARAVDRAAPEIERAASLCAKSYKAGGRIIFIGAGTSGRLGVMEAAECPPTFGINASRVIGIMAGGKNAVFKAKEGAEDDIKAGRTDILSVAKKGDCVIGIAASGVTLYALSALSSARKLGCGTVFITCNPLVAEFCADVMVIAETGPEALSGSTRMKAGTATKMILNAITTCAMVQNGKVYKNFMVDVQPVSRKLMARARSLITKIGGVSYKDSADLFKKSGYSVKIAIIMARRRVDAETARVLLSEAEGFLRRVIE